MTTFELIQKYLTTQSKDNEVCEYELNGNVIKIRYSKPYTFSDDRNYDNYLEIDLLDYLTWLTFYSARDLK